MQTGRRLFGRRLTAIGFITFGLLTADTTLAIDHVVGGSCGSTIQACIDFASPADTVQIPAGLYNEALTLTRAVSLIGDAASTTVVSAAGTSQRVLTIDGATIGTGVTVENLTFTAGDVGAGNVCSAGFDVTNCGGGIVVTGGAEPSIRSVVLDGNRAYRGGGLFVDEGIRLTLFNVTFLGNRSLVNAGGAYFDEPVTVLSCHFEENLSENNVGGAMTIAIDGVTPQGLATIRDTTFLNNIANSTGAGVISHAGAVDAFAVDLRIVDSRFEGNHCLGECDGGGVRFYTSFFPTTLTLERTDFVNNTAGRIGGGVAATSGLTLVLATDGTFQGNTAAQGGGLAAGTAEIAGTEFTGNDAAPIGISFNDGDGGGAFVTQCPSILDGARFDGNTAEHGGGLGCRFGTATITSTDFVGNTATQEGGGIWVEVGALSLDGGLVSTNAAQAGDGGGAFVEGSLDVTGTTFLSNTAGSDGGGARAGGGVVLNGGGFENNQAHEALFTFGGGGGGLHTSGSLDATGTFFLSNAATGALAGGAYAGGPVDLAAVVFDDNEAASSGGGLMANQTLSISAGSRFLNNRALGGQGGGAFAIDATDVTNGLFAANSATSSGGGLRAGGNLTLNLVEVTGNSAGSGGGVAGFAEVTVIDSSFTQNHSSGAGGGLSASFDPVSLLTSEFRHNTSVNDGAGVAGSSAIHVGGTVIADNQSTAGRGGGLSTNGFVTIDSGSEISGNTAFLDGGGAWANSGADLTDVLFQNNLSMTGNGGGLAATLGDLFATRATFRDNEAVDGGGALAFDVEDLNESLFAGNVAQGNGGAIWIRRFGAMETTRFSANQAQGAGGGVYRDGTGSTPTTIEACTFDLNSAAGKGGGIFNGSRPIDLINVTLSANSTGATGDAVYVDGGDTATLRNVTIIEAASAPNDSVFLTGASTLTWTNTVIQGTCFNDGATYVSAGGNIESGGNTCGLVAATDQVSVTSTLLGLDPALADNGGPTPTHALLAGSVAIDAGVVPCPAIDQRGALRFDGACDVGAYEDGPMLSEFELTLAEKDLLTWDDLSPELAYDVVRGDLGTLRDSGGEFTTATEECLADNHPLNTLSYTLDPADGEGFWFLVRQVTAAAAGGYDSGAASQAAPRDASIAASGVDCPIP